MLQHPLLYWIAGTGKDTTLHHVWSLLRSALKERDPESSINICDFSTQGLLYLVLTRSASLSALAPAAFWFKEGLV